MVSLRSLREARGLDSRDLAELIGEQGVKVHPDHLLNCELGHKRASAGLLYVWTHALGVRSIDVYQAKELSALVLGRAA